MRRVERYEVVIYSKKDANGKSRILADTPFNDFDNANLFRNNFLAASKNVGSTSIYHPGSTRMDSGSECAPSDRG